MECRVRDEGAYWDYKLQIGLDTPHSKAELARDLLAFANWHGGVLVYGISDDYRVVGVPRSQVPDTAKVKEKIQPYTGSEIQLFQSQIDLPARERCIWLLFVRERQGAPMPVCSNGPQRSEKNGRPIISKGDFFIRDGDQSKRCVDAYDMQRLFTNADFTHLQAYQYSLDIPYFRLLAPHTEQFVGRESVLAQLNEALTSRHPVVALDGVGGVGKSAIAIELTRRLYQEQNTFPIISLSAKNKVWATTTASRQAGFSGIGELLGQIASVLQMPVFESLEERKEAIITGLRDTPGLLLVDNMEEVSDPAVFRFLSREVPNPTKVLVTSRIDKGLGGVTISVPEMSEDEARSLLQHELERLDYNRYSSQQAVVDEIIETTGRLPLAIKWAAALADQRGDLAEAARLLRSNNGGKAEFLHFCFATMYDSLSNVAREVAQLCPYLGVEWNTSTIAIALDITMRTVTSAVEELQSRGIVLAADDGQDARQLLPFTMDFLRERWHENKVLRQRVEANLSDAFAADDAEGLLFQWTEDQKIAFLEAAVSSKLEENKFESARRLVELAIHIRSTPYLQFLAGRVDYEDGAGTTGLRRMEMAYRSPDKGHGTQVAPGDVAYLAHALLRQGSQADESNALALILECLVDLESITLQGLLSSASRAAVQHREFTYFNRLFRALVEAQAVELLYEAILPVAETLTQKAMAIQVGQALPPALRLSAKSTKCSPTLGKKFEELASDAQRQLGGLP